MDFAILLAELSNAAGPAGAEIEVAALITEQLRPFMDVVYTDTMGNVIGERHCGKAGAKRVLLEAHMDEIGYAVTGNRAVFLTLAALGRADTRHLSGARMRLCTDPPKSGIIAAMPPHLLTAKDAEKPLSIDDMLLDLGLSEEEAAEIPLGTPVVFDIEARTMGDTHLTGKALDNRASLAAILRALSQLENWMAEIDLFVVASVQEEVGCRGAGPAVFALKPDICICLDVTFASTPDTKRHVKQGAGAVITRGAFFDCNLADGLKSLAEQHEIPHQIEVTPARSSTSADSMGITRAGAPTALISLPLKYMHTAVELIDLRDLTAAADLLVAYLKGGARNA